MRRNSIYASVLILLACATLSYAQAGGPNLDWDGDGDPDYVEQNGFSMQIFEDAATASGSGGPFATYNCDPGEDACVFDYKVVNGTVESIFFGAVSACCSAGGPPSYWGFEIHDHAAGYHSVGSLGNFYDTTGANLVDYLWAAHDGWIQGLDPFDPYPGSKDDLALRTGVNFAPTDFPTRKSATGGDSLTVMFASPNGAFIGTTPVLAAQLFATGTSPSQPTGFPEAWINPSPFAPSPAIVLFDGNASPFSSFLPAGGTALGFNVPIFLSGVSIMLQVFALAPSATTGNPFFTATDGHVIIVN